MTADKLRSLVAGRWLRENATEVLSALVADGQRGLAIQMLHDALGMSTAQIIHEIDEARRQWAEEPDDPETEH